MFVNYIPDKCAKNRACKISEIGALQDGHNLNILKEIDNKLSFWAEII